MFVSPGARKALMKDERQRFLEHGVRQRAVVLDQSDRESGQGEGHGVAGVVLDR